MATDNNNLASQLRKQKTSYQGAHRANIQRPAYKVSFRRIFAVAIDTAVFMALGVVIVYLAGWRLIKLGEEGWWVGLIAVAVYFILLDSSIGKGRSFGKRIAGIEVRHISGRYLNPIETFIRFFPFGVIIAIFGTLRFSDPFGVSFKLFSSIFILIFLGIVCFILFHPQRRGIHDIIGDSVVVLQEYPFEIKKVSTIIPFIVFAVLGFFLTGPQLVFATFLSQFGPLKTFAEIRKTVDADTRTIHPTVFWTIKKDDKMVLVPTLKVSVYVPNFGLLMNPTQSKTLANDIRGMIPNDLIREIGLVAQLIVELRSGYDIGIGRNMITSEFPYRLSFMGQGSKRPTVNLPFMNQKTPQDKNKPGEKGKDANKDGKTGKPGAVAPPKPVSRDIQVIRQ